MSDANTLPPAEEIIALQVHLTGTETVDGAAARVDMLSFEGTTETAWFRGKTLPGGIDTQIHPRKGPVIYTDSAALKWLEHAELYGEVESSEDRLVIHIYSREVPGTETR